VPGCPFLYPSNRKLKKMLDYFENRIKWPHLAAMSFFMQGTTSVW
jgi:hypothetical protein